MRIQTHERVVGDTFLATWVSSGTTPQVGPSSALLDRNMTAISSVTASSSGGGHYYARHQLPNSAQPFVNEWRAWVNSFEYVNRQLVFARDVRVQE